ncbi:MAG: membrane protein insertase YidC [Bryobacterales bacterium]|nr:membrane protein insertase YidC [Bryobacterales bacterium]
MSEQNSGELTPKPSLGGPKKDLSMESRLLLAFGLMGVVLLVSQYILPQAPEPPKKTEVKAAPAEAKPASTADGTAEGKADIKAGSRTGGKAEGKAAATAKPAASVTAAQEQDFVIDTDLYKITFTNRGALVKSWILKKYKDSRGKPLEVVNSRAAGKANFPFAIRYRDGKGAHEINKALFAAKPSPDNLGIDFEYSSGGSYARKTFRFSSQSYLSRVTSELRENNAPRQHLLSWRGGFGDETVIGAAASQHAVLFDRDAQKLVSHIGKDVPGGVFIQRGNFTFAGLQDTYFAAVALPAENAPFEVHMVNDHLPNAIDEKEDYFAGVSVGGEASNQFQLFLGPKDLDLMRTISPRLDQLVDWGWFGVIAKPLFLALSWLNNKYVHNYGWSIILLTIIINFLMLPLKFTSLKSMRAMSALQPEMKKINDKYAGMGMRDPRKQKQQEEVMALYKLHGVNPASGCVPMLLQIPFFFAYYKVLSVSIEMRGAHWLWVSDLSRPEDLAIRVLPLLMIASQFVMQKMTPNTSGDPAQQKMLLMMPLFLGFMFYGQSSGLVLYWLTGNLVGILQQWFFNRMAPAPAPATVPAAKRNPKK